MNESIQGENAAMLALLQLLWRRRWFVLIGIAFFTVLGVAALQLARVYRSEGFYQLGDLSYSDYKRYNTSFFTKDRLAGVAEHLGIGESAVLSREVWRVLNDPATRNRYVDPVFPFTKADARDLPEVLPEKNTSHLLIGIRYSYEDRTPERAQLFVRLMAESVRDGLLSGRLFEHISTNLSNATNDLRGLENKMFAQRFEKEQLARKLEALSKVLRKYPGSAPGDARQVISVEKGGAEYLSPLVQIVGIESKLADATAEFSRLTREREMAALRKDYYTGAKALFENSRMAETVLLGLEPLKENVFKAKNLDDDTVKDVYNGISVENENLRRYYFDGLRFVSGPTLPERPVSPRLVVWIPLILVGAFFLMAVIALGWDWVETNWRVIRQR
jgi:hypothetical protein